MPLEASPISRRRGDSGVANEGTVVSRLRRSDRGRTGLSRRSPGNGSAAHPANDPRPAGLRGRLELVCPRRSRDQLRPLAERFVFEHGASAARCCWAPLTIGNGTNWTTTNFTGGAGFGYRWNDWLRFDATWDYRTGPGGTRQTTVVCPYAPLAPLPTGFLYNTTNTC